jgi:hypothetical protein
LALAPDGTLLVGDAAEQQAAIDPARVLRHVTLRADDPVPIVLADRYLPGNEAVALLLHRVVEMVSAREGAAPDAVAIAHPAWWGPSELGPVRKVLQGVTTMPAPVAAVVAGGRSDGLVAVLDVDAGLTASVVRAAGPRHAKLAGPPVTALHPSGAAIVDPVFAHVRQMLRGTWPRFNPHDAVVREAVTELRRSCAQAAVTLSARPFTHVEVDLPGLQTRLPVDRLSVTELVFREFDEVLEILEEALDAAGVAPAHLDEIVVTGSLGRFPLVVEAIGTALGLPVVPAPLPVAALGAATVCRDVAAPTGQPVARPAKNTTDATVGMHPENGTPDPVPSRRRARHRATPQRGTRFVAAAVAVGATIGGVAASALALSHSAAGPEAATVPGVSEAVATPNDRITMRVPTVDDVDDSDR